MQTAFANILGVLAENGTKTETRAVAFGGKNVNGKLHLAIAAAFAKNPNLRAFHITYSDLPSDVLTHVKNVKRADKGAMVLVSDVATYAKHNSYSTDKSMQRAADKHRRALQTNVANALDSAKVAVSSVTAAFDVLSATNPTTGKNADAPIGFVVYVNPTQNGAN